MTDSHDPEAAVRRALAEVAATTPTDPPPLTGTVVPLTDHRHRRVLAAVAAVVAVVAGITGAALLAGGGDEPEDVETAEDATTSTTDDPPTTTSSATTATTGTTATTATTAPPSTSVSTATTVVTAPPRGELLATGDGWEVRLVDGCVVVLGNGEHGRACDRDRDVWLLAAPLDDGRIVHVAGGRRVGAADGFTGGGIVDDRFQVVADSGTGRYVVSDAVPSTLILREGPGSDWVAAVHGGRLVTDGPAFAGFGGYQRATGSLSMGRFQEIGGYHGGGGRCVLARQVNPEPAVVVDFCDSTDPVSAVLVPTEHPELFDVFGLAGAVGQWTCELPDGTSCGGGDITAIAGFGGIIAGRGPMNIGPSATEVVIAVDRGSVVVPVPREA
jgi:hypothetical protein